MIKNNKESENLHMITSPHKTHNMITNRVGKFERKGYVLEVEKNIKTQVFSAW